MIIIVKYERKTIFGDREYTEDKRNNANLSDLKKAFAFLKKGHEVALEIENTVIFWDNMTEYENNVVSCRIYDENRGYKEEKKSFEICKKLFYKLYK